MRVREARYRARLIEASSELHNANGKVREVVVASLCSEHSLSVARGPDWEAAPIPPVLERLVGALEEGVTPHERQLLKWLGNQISYTKIAEWLGVTRPAAVSRIQRLRRRLIEAALRFGSGLERTERAELAAFLRRTGTIAEDRVRALRGVPPPRAATDTVGPAQQACGPQLPNGKITEDREP